MLVFTPFPLPMAAASPRSTPSGSAVLDEVIFALLEHVYHKQRRSVIVIIRKNLWLQGERERGGGCSQSKLFSHIFPLINVNFPLLAFAFLGLANFSVLALTCTLSIYSN